MTEHDRYEREAFLPIEPGVRVRYRTNRGPEPHYAVLLEKLVGPEQWTTVRCWDNADRVDEHHMHRYSASGNKEPATLFSHGKCNDAQKDAIAAAYVVGADDPNFDALVREGRAEGRPVVVLFPGGQSLIVHPAPNADQDAMDTLDAKLHLCAP